MTHPVGPTKQFSNYVAFQVTCCRNAPIVHLTQPTETLAQLKPLISTILVMFFISFPITSYPFDHMPQALDRPNHIPSQANQYIIILYTDTLVTYVSQTL